MIKMKYHFFSLEISRNVEKSWNTKRLIKKKKNLNIYNKNTKEKKQCSQKIIFFFFLEKKNVLQSTPYQNPGGVPWASRTDGRRIRKKIYVFNIKISLIYFCEVNPGTESVAGLGLFI